MYLQRYHPVTKYKDEYRQRQAELERAIENHDDEKVNELEPLPPAVATVGLGVDGTATRQ